MLPNTPYVILYYIIYSLILKTIAFNIIKFKKGKKVLSFILLVLLELVPNFFLIASNYYVTGFEGIPFYMFIFQLPGIIILYFWAEGNALLNFIILWFYGQGLFYCGFIHSVSSLASFMEINKPVKAYSSFNDLGLFFSFVIICIFSIIFSIILHNILQGFFMNIYKSMLVIFIQLFIDIIIINLTTTEVLYKNYHIRGINAIYTDIFQTQFLLFVLFFFYRYTIKRNKRAFEKLYANTSENIISVYDKIIDSQNAVRMWRHDVNNHLAVLNNLNVSSQIIEKTTELLNDTNKNFVVHTKNPIFDTLINLKFNTAIEKQIATEVEIFFPSSDDIIINNTDLICLFSNLIDNAIEASEQVESSERKISLKVTPQYNLLYINLSNSKKNTSVIFSGKNRSTKANPEEHGLGTQIIDNIIHKYNGDITYTDNNNIMNIEAIIPLNK